MWALILALAVDTATACSCARPPFLVVGAPRPAPPEGLPEPGFEVGTRPVLVVSYSTIDGPNVRIRQGRFVPMDGGSEVGGRVLRTRVPYGQELPVPGMRTTERQAEIGAARDLSPGDYAFELPGRRKTGWSDLGIRLRVIDATASLAEEPFTPAWEYEPSGRPGDCRVGGWQLHLTRGQGFEGDTAPMAYDVYVTEAGARSELFWGTVEGTASAVVIGDTDMCTLFAFGELAPRGGARLRIVPRFRGGEPTAGQVVMLPARGERPAPAAPR